MWTMLHSPGRQARDAFVYLSLPRGSPFNSLGPHPNQLLHLHPITIWAFPRPFLPTMHLLIHPTPLIPQGSTGVHWTPR